MTRFLTRFSGSLFLIFWSLVFSFQVEARPLDPLASALCQNFLNSDESVFGNELSAELRPFYADLKLQFKEMSDAIGGCETFTFIDGDENSGRYAFISLSRNQIILNLSKDREGRLSSLRFEDINLRTRSVEDWNEAKRFFEDLPGEISYSVKNDRKFRSEVFNSYKKIPIEGLSQLYILSALAKKIKSGGVTWNQEMSIRESLRSLGSGEMQNWPEGTKATVADFTQKMINNDTTANDHLLWLLGRTNVEKELRYLKNSFSADNTPFLSHSEVTKLKWAAPLSLTQTFIEGDETTRRETLRKITDLPLELIGTNGVELKTPSLVDQIGWFGSTNDICSASFGLKKSKSEEILNLLAYHTPLVKVGGNSHWQYAGFKEGMEPGVHTMAYLLKTTTDQWGCVAVSWKSSHETLNRFILYDYVQKLLKLSESVIE